MYNTSILGDFEFLAYGSCCHYEKVAKTRYSQAGFMGLFFVTPHGQQNHMTKFQLIIFFRVWPFFLVQQLDYYIEQVITVSFTLAK